MQVYSFYIFDRHTECIYSKTWFSPPPPPPSSTSLTTTTTTSPSTSRPQSQQPAPHPHPHPTTTTTTTPAPAAAPAAVLPRKSKNDDNAKLIFGTVFSLRNMVRKLGGDDDAFIAYRTAGYKLHYYETPTNLRFALLTEPGALSMRNVLHQIYINLWVEYVVKNPLSPVEHRGGDGVRNEMFEMGLDKFVRGLM
ncbi:snare-like protein [Hypoxylon rubiginosum]|uniref:Snare-like protein n=1 Tax=Hypoxylon rubiginosum TaxID=110542 RepID=A0ACB9Z2H6_9PEZI|nr:snare-like protein [Hypoxylon rubiginosum]